MRLSKAWIIASKDFRIFRKKKSIILTIVGFEIFVSALLPLIIMYAEHRREIPVAVLISLMNAFSYWFP